MGSRRSSDSAGWYQDPFGRFEYRFWDGVSWSEHVSTGGVVSVDPLTTSSSRGGGQTSVLSFAFVLVLWGMLGSVVWFWSLPSHKEMLRSEDVFDISLEGMVDSGDTGIDGSCSHFQLLAAPREIKRTTYIQFAEEDRHLRSSSAGELIEKVEDAGWVLSSDGTHSGRWVFTKKIGSWRKGYEGRLDVYFDPAVPIVIFGSKSDCESSPPWFTFPLVYSFVAIVLVIRRARYLESQQNQNLG